MLRILLLVLVVLLTGAGGTGAWWFGVRGEPVPFLDDEADEAAAAPAAAASAFVELDPFTFPVLEEGRVVRLMTLVVSFEVGGQAAKSAVMKARPRLRDALLSDLHGLYSLRFVREREDALALVKKRLLATCRRVVEARVRAVYVQSVGTRESSAQG